MTIKLKQLVPGNPGTSFVVCMLYAISKKYGIKVSNEDQLSIFVDGIVNSRKVFFSGILNTIASKFNLKVHAFINNTFLIRLAKGEVDKKIVKLELNQLDMNEIKRLLDEFEYITFSVDMFVFMGYHDLHFVCISKTRDGYEVFEPKFGRVEKMTERELEVLINSVQKGLGDVSFGFCC